MTPKYSQLHKPKRVWEVSNDRKYEEVSSQVLLFHSNQKKGSQKCPSQEVEVDKTIYIWKVLWFTLTGSQSVCTDLVMNRTGLGEVDWDWVLDHDEGAARSE